MYCNDVCKAIFWVASMQLECKCPHMGLTELEKERLFPLKQEGSLPAVHGPVFLATRAAWKKLMRCSEKSFVKCTSEGSMFRVQEKLTVVRDFPVAKLHNWIFVPSYNRYADSDPHQMRIDWADAMSQDTHFVRVIVVRSDQQQVQVNYVTLLPQQVLRNL